MFTGIITAVGMVRRMTHQGDVRLEITCPWPPEALEAGESIACSGVCLTVVEKGGDAGGDYWFAADASRETLDCTTLGSWQGGSRVNLERALAVGERLGGHIVSGHVDGVAVLESIVPEGASHRLEFSVPKALAKYIAAKGSVTLDGISLTVNQVSGVRFGVNIIPHSWENTTLRDLKPGDGVNLEVDVLARYIERLHLADG